MSCRVHIVVAEPSLIIRSGITSVLHRLTSMNIDVAEISDLSSLVEQLEHFVPDILIIDPSHIGFMTVNGLKAEMGLKALKFVALQNSLSDSAILKQFDEVISLYDSSDSIKSKIIKCIDSQDKQDGRQELSAREKEIVVCIVGGMTNKIIAEKLFLSTHTVITHRRNITNKLQIHSSSGLTIYAIVNKLVDIDDVKDTIFSEE